MDKMLCWACMGVAGLTLVFFIGDLVMRFLPSGVGMVFDILGVLCCGVLGYLAWNAYRDVR